MKTFTYENGTHAGQTMTVGELKKKLEEYPEDMPVWAQWEGVHAYIEPDMFTIEFVGKGRISMSDDIPGLVIDVNHY